MSERIGIRRRGAQREASRVVGSLSNGASSADLDLAVLDAGPESVNLGELAPGDNSIEISSWLSLPETSYTGTVAMAAKSLVQKREKKRHRRRCERDARHVPEGALRPDRP